MDDIKGVLSDSIRRGVVFEGAVGGRHCRLITHYFRRRFYMHLNGKMAPISSASSPLNGRLSCFFIIIFVRSRWVVFSIYDIFILIYLKNVECVLKICNG